MKHFQEPKLDSLVLTGTAMTDSAKHCRNTGKSQKGVAKGASEPSAVQNTLRLVTPASVNKAKLNTITENSAQVHEKHVSSSPVVMIELHEVRFLVQICNMMCKLVLFLRSFQHLTKTIQWEAHQFQYLMNLSRKHLRTVLM